MRGVNPASIDPLARYTLANRLHFPKSPLPVKSLLIPLHTDTVYVHNSNSFEPFKAWTADLHCMGLVR